MSETHQHINRAAIRDCLHRRNFRTLFIEHLGWDKDSGNLAVEIAGATFTLTAVAQKRGFRILHCPQIPDRATRNKIDNKITAVAYEHLIIFASGEEQIWQWTRRQPGRPAASRYFTIATGQSGESLTQKLAAISFSLDEEDSVTIVTVAGRASAAFDVEKVTKRFYDQFKTEHAALLTFIKGIAEAADLQWYGSLMLNRLMFVYFIQKKGFLDNDVDYLRTRLNLLQQRHGKDKFHSFYRYFLLHLFHDGLGKAPARRDAEMEKLLGKVPYLNGGFFEVHQLEQKYPDIDIPDAAFAKLFDFFDRYRWHLDERPCRAENEINPDVVGYIFEKYINQKQMGAYYTKEDITEYISKNTLIPFLFDAAKKACPIAFKPGGYLWRLLSENPDHYIYPAVRKGVIQEDGNVIPESDLPDFVQTGMRDPNARMFDKRYNLSQSEKDDPIRLPTETWREYIARRTRCLEIREKLKAGHVHEINDLITLNLDIWQFARDAISKCEGPELLRAFWNAIREITVLDPTCGSGAFLFAALRILETLYEDCLGRMEGFASEAISPNGPEKFTDFRQVLAQQAKHPSEAYFILKSIIINNLFGVDIMPEAVEICKLRLFLKLAAQAQTFEQIEPLPDIDFNIRAGNTLVGYATLESLKKSQEGKLLFSAGELADIERNAIGAARIFSQFKDLQIPSSSAAQNPSEQQSSSPILKSEPWGLSPILKSEPRGLSPRASSDHIAETKTAMRQALAKLADRLDRYLAGEYNIDVEKKPAAFEKWKSTHQPFHWFTEFYTVMSKGGFDVVIGNPPYVEYAKIKSDYTIIGFRTIECNNLWTFVMEHSVNLLKQVGRCGLIVPMSLVCTDRMIPIQTFLRSCGSTWLSNYESDSNPGQLFTGVKQNISISIYAPGAENHIFTTRLFRFFAEARNWVFPLVEYTDERCRYLGSRFPKMGRFFEREVLDKLFRHAPLNKQMSSSASEIILVHRIAHYYIKCFDFVPYFRSDRDGEKKSEDYKEYTFSEPHKPLVAIINSSLFYFYWQALFDGFKAGKVCIENFPSDVFPDVMQKTLTKICEKLMMDIRANATRLCAEYTTTGKVEYDQFRPRLSKPIIDEIDRVLAEHYGFTPEELDFIINYDIKYRMGAEAGEEQ